MTQYGGQRARGRHAKDETVSEEPADLGKRSWTGVLGRTAKEFKEDNLTDWAAALTYYGVLALFPALLALVSLLGLFGETAIRPLTEALGGLAPGPVREILTTALVGLQNGQGAGIVFVVGIAVALWSAAGYVAAFMRASNAVYDMPEGRPLWIALPVRLGITAALVVLVAVSAVAAVFTGGLAGWAGEALGFGDTAVRIWDIAKWPVIVLIVALVLALLYWAAPNVRHPGFRWVTPGSVPAVLLWLAACAAFAFYVANFGNYNETYGTLAGAVIFLIWLWISNIAVLLGVELNAELQRGRRIAAGEPPDQEPYAAPRSTRKFKSGAPRPRSGESARDRPQAR